MINALRKKFIIITMVSVIIVFSVILGIINVVNYVRVTNDTDNIVNFLASNNGAFMFNNNTVPPEMNEGEPPPEENAMEKRDRSEYQKSLDDFKIDRETPYATRYFTINYDDNGNLVSSNLNRIAISSEEANELANKVLSSNSLKGYVGSYRYKVVDDQHMIIFVDSSQQLGNVKNFLFISAIVAVSGVVAILILIVAISSYVVKPIAESYEKQKQFITDASHELKTPLTIISANNEITEIEHGESDSTKAITKQVSRMTSMVKNLTALARLDEATEAEKADLNLTTISNEMIELFRPALTTNERVIECSIEDGIIYRGEEKLIRQLLSVVLENAAKYAKTQTSFNLSKNGQKIIILAKNDAEGIVEGDMSKCFERFYRESTSRASGIEGSGIGLSIAKEIVKKHKGSISAFGDCNGCFNIKIVL